VCTDESPEGNLPASFRDMEIKSQQLVDQASADLTITNANTSQLILHHCFRTIKEATSTLATCMEQFPLPTSKINSEKTLSYNWVLETGELLSKLLSSIRHKGAFVAVGESYSRVVTSILNSDEEFLIELPRKWLEYVLKQICQAGASITRRSAGLPMAFAAITGTTKYGRNTLLEDAMREVLAVAKTPVTGPENEIFDLPQVHAMNVIKTVIQSSDMAEDYRKFTADAFELCIKGFSSPYFPIRNCAFMLFSAIFTRTLATKVP
jgi:hypothetical protein